MSAPHTSKMSATQAALYWTTVHDLAIFPLWWVEDDGRCGCGDVACRNAGKHPVTPNGHLDATNEMSAVGALWAEYPRANIGMPCDRNGRVVIDIDPRNGGADSLAQLEREARSALASTWHVNTGGGGEHFHFAAPNGHVPGKIGPGVDVKYHGYVLLPPSNHASGRRYELAPLADLAQPLPSIPGWLLTKFSQNGNGTNPRRSVAEWQDVIGGVSEGARQDELPRVVGLLYARVPELARTLAHQYGAGCVPPLTEQEVDACCDRIGAREAMKPQPASDGGHERYTDMANAARIADEAAGRAVHVVETKDRWHVYDGVKLVEDQRPAVVPFVKQIASRLYAEAAKTQREAKERAGALTQTSANMTSSASSEERDNIKGLEESAALCRMGATRLESRDGCYAAIELAKAEPRLRVKMAELDTHPLWLNTPTATIDLETGKTWTPRFEDYLTKSTRAKYDPTAKCPHWTKFLERVLPSVAVRSFMQRTVGYALTDRTNEQCLWFLYGLGRNGKSTFVNAVRYMLGDYAANTKASTLMVKQHGDDKRNDIAILRGARFVSVTETEDGQQMAESLIKEITGQDPVTARLMYAEFFTFVPTFKIMLAANHKPVMRGQDMAIWRRIKLVPFTETISLEERDKDLPATLEAEASGILNWAIEGFKDWQQGGLRPPAEVEAATEAYRLESDVLREFFEDCLIVGPGREASARDVFQAYQRWADQNGVQRPLTQQGLGRLLAARGYRPAKRTGGRRVWEGFSVRTA